MSIRNKILLLVISSIAIIVGLISTMVYIQTKDSLTEAFKINALAQSERMKDYTNKFLNDAIELTEYLSKHPLLVNARGNLTVFLDTPKDFLIDYANLNNYEKQVFDLFQSYTIPNHTYSVLYLATNDGGFILQPPDRLPANYDPRKRDWYNNALQKSNSTFLSSGYVSTNKNFVYSLSKAILNNQNQSLGVVSLDINISELSKFFNKIKIGKTGHAIIVEDNGTIVTDSDNPNNMGKKLADIGAKSLEKFFAEKEGFDILPISGEQHLAFVTTTRDNWRFFLLMDEEEATGNALIAVKNSIFISVGAAVLLIIASLFIVRTIVAPINRLVRVAGDVSTGNLEAVGRNDKYVGELKSLHQSIVNMVDNLAKFITTANNKTEEANTALVNGQKALTEAELARQEALTAKSQGMRAAASELTGIVTYIEKVAQALSSEIDYSENGTTEQAARISQTSVAMEEMNSTVLEVAKNASRAAFVTTKAKEKATAGAKAMQEVVSEMRGIEQDSQALNTDIAILEDRAQSISKIMGVISDIADQTNLLALNAAIEAARAGEAGRGFAVVADEVRKLAEKTMISTADVGNTINAIQQSVSKSRMQMDKSIKGIESATVKAQDSGQALNEIQEMVDQAQSEVQAIATASEQQSATSEEITRDIGMINDIANNTATAMQKSGNIIRDLTSQAHTLDNLIEEMKKA